MSGAWLLAVRQNESLAKRAMKRKQKHKAVLEKTKRGRDPERLKQRVGGVIFHNKQVFFVALFLLRPNSHQ